MDRLRQRYGGADIPGEHSLRLPAPMDGTQDVQPTIAPGEQFEYRFALPDAGTFWYHPHTNETVQLERGLYGVLVVRGDDEPVVIASWSWCSTMCCWISEGRWRRLAA